MFQADTAPASHAARFPARWARLCVLAWCVVGAPAAAAQSPLGSAWVDITPRVGTLDEVERSPLNPALVLARSGARLVRSTDGGATFAEVPLGLATAITDIEFGRDGALVVAAGTTVYVSLDSGVTFAARPVTTPPNGSIQTLAVDPQDSQKLWAGLAGAPRVLRSLDRGATWTDVTPSGGLVSDCVALDVDPSNTSRAIAVSRNYQAHVNDDGGATWHAAQYINAGDTARDVAFVGGDLVLTTSSRVLHSADLGLSWSMLPPPVGASTAFFFANGAELEADPMAPGLIRLATSSDGAFQSSDGGLTWAPIPNTRGLAATSLASDGQGQLLLASSALGLIALPSGGAPTLAGAASLAALGVTRALRPLQLASDPRAPQNMALIATDLVPFSSARFLLRTSDGGASWGLDLDLGARPSNAYYAPDGRLYVTASVPVSPAVLPGALLRRDPSGWAPIGPTGITGTDTTLFGVVASAAQPTLLFASSTTFDPNATFGGGHVLEVHRSLDDGATWTPVYRRVADTFTRDPQLVLTEAGGLRAVHLLDSGLDSILSGFDSISVQSSRDDGATWSYRPLAQQQEAYSQALAPAPADPGRVYATNSALAGASNPEPLLRSDDGGQTWVGAGAPLEGVHRFVGSSVAPGVVYDARKDGVQRVEYGGEAAYDLDLAPGPMGFEPKVYAAGDPERVFALGEAALYVKDLPALVGANTCGPAVVNSTGEASGILAVGSTSVAANALTLRARRVPLQSTGLFLVSNQLGFVPGAGGSTGALCLSGAVGRFGPNPAQSGSTGELTRPIDLTALPRPAGPVPVQAGQTWAFQVWFRDTSGGAATSNFSDAIRVTFTP
ncbi:MAG: hypothetical protein R3F49_23350 [Planctomycetota bacterium]